MRLFILSYLLVMFTFLLASCTKQAQIESKTSTYKSSIKSCNCTNTKDADFRIEATINGEKLCFDRMQRPVHSDSWRKTSYDSSIGIGRHNIDSTLQIAIQYKNPRFHKSSLPYHVDSSNVQYCETVYITLLNLKPFMFCEGCSSDDSYYTALSSVSNLSVSILSFKDNVIEGTFEGDFNNRSPEKFKVTNGYFKTKLEILQ